MHDRSERMTGHAQHALGINGLGRIGKLTVWHHAARGHFPGLVVNLGREAGRDLEAVCGVIENDSTYGSMHRFLFGVAAKPCVRIVDRERRLLDVAGTPVTILQSARNPREIDWRGHDVGIVVDTTGAFDDPTRPADHPSGSLRGHLLAGAERVIYSAAFRTRDDAPPADDTATLVFGINHDAFTPARHELISAASCTTTALAHMVAPLLRELGPTALMTASASTVHAATNSQSLLDGVPAAGARDLRKTRSALNSIILTSTNAARALELVLPEIALVGFMADSVRIPIPTLSLLILNVTFQTRIGSDGQASIRRDVLNDIYRRAADGPQRDLLVCSDRQNVPADLRGARAAVVIEATETHTRTGFVSVNLEGIAGAGAGDVQVPVTHAKLFGWYDNEFGSYTNMLGDLTVHVETHGRR
jgi:glyceraldehyde 3-phosphate dehydrogenase